MGRKFLNILLKMVFKYELKWDDGRKMGFLGEMTMEKVNF